MVLTLVVPGLLWPPQVMRDTLYDAHFPALETLLGKGRRLAANATSAEAWWHAYFGVESRSLAAAPLRLSALGTQPEDAQWLCIDPLHLRVNQSGAAITDPALLNISAAEARHLHALLSPLFADMGELVVTTPSHWHLRLEATAPDFPDHLHDLIEQPAVALLPAGDSGRAWRQLINEVQMALHSDPINTERAAAGKAIINSIAVWGKGRAPVLRQKAPALLLSDDLIVTGAGRLAGLDTGALPPQFAIAAMDQVVNWDVLRFPAARHDALAWRDTLQQLEQFWLVPALAALANGDLKRIELHGFGDQAPLALAMTSFDRYRFWRKPRRLEAR